MPIPVRCECGRELMAKDESAGRRTNCPDCGRELVIPSSAQDAFDEKDYPRRPGLAPDIGPQKDYRGSGEAETSGKAVTSFVLGLLSIVLCLNILTGIPAIILGILGLNDVNRSGGRRKGSGFAIAGIVTGGVG